MSNQKYSNRSSIVFSIIVVLSSFMMGCVPVAVTPPCDPANPPIKTTPTPTLGTWQGTMQTVSYGTDPNQNMDVYLPTLRDSTTKVFVLIHGGAWNNGSSTFKSEMTTKYLPTLKSRFPNAAFYNVEYRLHQTGTTINRFSTQENDINTAVNFIINRVNSDNVSKKIILFGASAGGHLALLNAYKYNSLNYIKAVITFFPATNISTLQDNDGTDIGIATSNVANNIIPSITGNDSILKYNSSPVNFVTSTSPPTLFFHGTNDHTINYNQSVNLNAVLTAKNAMHRFESFPCEEHGFLFGNVEAAINIAQAFVNTYIP